MKRDLEPCPFCEGEAHLERKSRTVVQGVTVRHTYVRCLKCGSRGSRFLYRDFATCKEAEGKAVEAWNRRASDENACANKCGLECIRTNVERVCVKPEKGQCPRCEQLVGESLEHIQWLEASYRQVSKALCGKENATLDEVLQAVSQVKSGYTIPARSGKTLAMQQAQRIAELEKDLAAVKRERDALLEYLTNSVSLHCDICKHESDDGAICCQRLRDLKEKCFEWRGVCPENTEVQEDV